MMHRERTCHVGFEKRTCGARIKRGGALKLFPKEKDNQKEADDNVKKGK